MADWDDHPDLYQKDENGNFLLKKDGTPRKLGGRPKGVKSRGYHFHSETKEKIRKRRVVRTKEKKIEQIERKLNKHRQSLKKAKTVSAQLDKDNTSKIITEYKLTSIPKIHKD